MSRMIERRLKLIGILSVLVGLGVLWHPELLLAAPFAFGIVEGDGDGGDTGGDDTGGDEGGDDDADEGGSGAGDDADDGDEAEGEQNAAGGQRPGKKKPGARTPNMIPAYRLEQERERMTRLLTEESGKNRQLLEGLKRALGGDAGDGTSTPALTPKQKELRKQFLELFPEFGSLLEVAPKSKDVLALLGRAPEWDRETDQYWDRVAKSTTTRLNTFVSKQLGLSKLDADTDGVVRTSFISWVKADRTGARNDRYEGQDESLISDFWKFFSSRFRTGAQRPANADALRRSAAPMPRGGNSSTHMARGQRPARPKADQDPFEAVNDRAWQQLQDVTAGEQ